MSDHADVLQGTLDLLVLRTIALEPMHKWAIAQRIQQISNVEAEGAKWERLSAGVNLVLQRT